MPDPLLVAQSDHPLELLPGMANRHGLVAGATGTGKTVSLQVMAEAFSRIGVPVFAADVKGDLSGISQPGVSTPKIAARIQKARPGLSSAPSSCHHTARSVPSLLTSASNSSPVHSSPEPTSRPSIASLHTNF